MGGCISTLESATQAASNHANLPAANDYELVRGQRESNVVRRTRRAGFPCTLSARPHPPPAWHRRWSGVRRSWSTVRACERGGPKGFPMHARGALPPIPGHPCVNSVPVPAGDCPSLCRLPPLEVWWGGPSRCRLRPPTGPSPLGGPVNPHHHTPLPRPRSPDCGLWCTGQGPS